MKNSKKIFCLFLSVVMFVCSISVAATAYCDEQKNKDVTPVVVIPGVGSSALYLYPNTSDQTSPLSVDSDFIGNVAKTHIVRDTLKIMAGGNVSPEIWTNKLASVIEPFTVLNFDKSGSSILENVGIDCYWTDSLANHLEYLDSRPTAEPAVCKAICDNIGPENVWIYNYDFREDVIKDAEQLSEFIDGVKEQSGKDKVTLVGCSLGTSVLSAYIDKYNSENDIEKAIFLDGAMQGVSIAKLFKGDLVLDSEIVSKYMSLMASDYKGNAADFEMIGNIFGRFDGTVNNFVSFLSEVTNEENIGRFYTKVILPILGNIPSLWECIPYEDFDECCNFMSDLGWLDKNSGLSKIITEYHGIQGRLEENLKNLEKEGVDIAIVCGYGLPGIPVTSANANQSDMLIDTCYASFGATVSNSGETIENATSADGMIDTSTCRFKDSTWFLWGVQHMEFVYGTDVNDFIGKICTTDINLNIADFEKEYGYSQFTALQDGGTELKNVK